MSIETILTTILRAAAFLKKPIGEVASQSVKDAYHAAKEYLARKLSENPESTDALEKATAKPESEARRDVLLEETKSAGLEHDAELVRLVVGLADLLPLEECTVRQNVRVSGRSNRVFIAGRNLIRAERLVQRSAITPDQRHINVDQRETIRELIAELAVRLAAEDGRPNFAAAHRILQRRFNVASYSLIPAAEFADA